MTSTPVQPSARRKKAKAYWVPREHGAWSWLISPVLAGAILSPHLHQLLLLGVALGGYLFFNAASWWAKMPPKRRVDAVPPALTYAALTAALALALLVTAGWGVLGWFGVLLVPLAVAFVLTLRRAGRSLASGLATAVASSALLLVAVQPDLPALLAHSQASTWWAFAIMYGSTAGTLFAVKSMIRESGSNAFLAASVAWHLAWVAVAAGGTAYGLPLAWTAYFLLTTVRAAALPLIARRHPLRPGTIGIVELCLTLVLLALYVWPGV